MKRTPVLVIGGTGVFGKRLVQHLAMRTELTVYLSSRSAVWAERLARSIQTGKASLHGIALDHTKDLCARLTEIKPAIVIDCSGPFQGASYDTARAVIQSGAHLIDLADARKYLAGFAPALNATARARGVTALTGASSTPTLSTCVIRHLTHGWQQIDNIDICITPGGKSEVGHAVIAAILSYAGLDIPVWEDGRLSTATGWSSARIVDMPGLGRRRVALVETYDAEYLGSELKVCGHVRFSAGLESKIEQWGVETIAKLRKRGWLGDLRSLIPLLLTARRITRIPTSDTGGMLVRVTGKDAKGAQCSATWSLVARQDHGPYVPVLPAAAALDYILRGVAAPGARFAHNVLSLRDICEEIGPYPITTQIRSETLSPSDAPMRRAV